MRRIIKYNVIRRVSLLSLEAATREAIGCGWQPLGGVSVYLQPKIKVDGSMPIEVYHQAVVQYEAVET